MNGPWSQTTQVRIQALPLTSYGLKASPFTFLSLSLLIPKMNKTEISSLQCCVRNAMHETLSTVPGMLYTFFSPFLWNFGGWHWLTKLYGSQVHNSTTHHLYTVLCSPPQVKAPSITIYTSSTPFYLPPHPLPSAITIMLSVSMRVFCLFSFLFNPYTPTQPPKPPTAISLLSMYESVSNLLVSSYCPLDFTYKWNYMVVNIL